MKKIRVFFLLFFGICGNLFSQNNDSLQYEKVKSYINQINKDKVIQKKTFIVTGKDKVRYNYSLRKGEIVQISRTWNRKHDNRLDTFTDEYYLKNGKPIFAYQSIYDQSIKDPDDSISWSCNFLIDGDKAIIMTSLGHGKTESDDWDYEREVKENFDFMMKTVKKHINK